MAKGKRKRAKASKPAGPAQTAAPVSPDQPAPVHSTWLRGMDRWLTLMGYGGLILLAVWLLPRLGNRREQDFTRAVDQTVALLGQREAAPLHQALAPATRERRSEAELAGWLRELGVQGLKQPQVLMRQTARNGMGLARLRFTGASGESGLLTVWMLQQPSLELNSGWQLANLCRPDQKARALGERLLAALHQPEAAALTQLKALVPSAPEAAAPTPAALLQQAKALGLDGAKPVWGDLDAAQSPLRLQATGPKGPFTLAIHELPQSCDYQIAGLEAQKQAE